MRPCYCITALGVMTIVAARHFSPDYNAFVPLSVVVVVLPFEHITLAVRLGTLVLLYRDRTELTLQTLKNAFDASDLQQFLKACWPFAPRNHPRICSGTDGEDLSLIVTAGNRN
jgi:hypothetical protein